MTEFTTWRSLVDGEIISGIPDSGGTHQWNFDEASGSTVADSIGSLDGEINGASWQTDLGAGDAYLSFDGTDDFVDLDTASQSAFTHFTENGEGTLFAWVNPDAVDNIRAIFSSTPISDEVGITFTIRDGGDVRGAIFDGSGDEMANLTATDAITTSDGWIPLAMVADGSTIRIYGDNPITELNSGSISGGTTDDFDSNVSFGRRTSLDDSYFDGGIDLPWTDEVARSESALQSFVDDSAQFYD